MQVAVLNQVEFEQRFSAEVRRAEFSDTSEEEAYERRDRALVGSIKHVCENHVGVTSQRHVHHNEDWWPDHTRGVKVAAHVCDGSLLRELQQLLIDDFPEFRIQFVVYNDVSSSSSTHLGSICLTPAACFAEERAALS
ncbi:MAG: hypothetical protein AAF085_17885 [Planctomycetota bacterium]